MNRQQFNHLRHLNREFIRWGKEIKLDGELAGHLLRWWQAEYAPNAEAALSVFACLPGRAVSHTEMLKTCPDQRAARMSQARMARYYRKPCPLPDRGTTPHPPILGMHC